jgi:hypothetical protein
MLLNELGLDPGLDHILTVAAIDKIRRENNGEATILSVKSKCGALPRLDTAMTSPFRYKFSWSREGVLRAFTRPAKVVEQGKVITIDSPYDQFKPISVCGLALESVANEDSSNYRTTYFATDVERKSGSIERNTLRLKGSIETFGMLRHAGFFDDAKSLPDTIAKALTPVKFSDYCLGQAKANKKKLDKQLGPLLLKVGLSDETPSFDATGLTPLQVTARFLGPRYDMKGDDRDMSIMHIEIEYYKTMLHASCGQRSTRTLAFIEYGNDKTTSVARLVGQCVSAAALAVLDGSIQPSSCTGVQRPLDPKMAHAILKTMRPEKNLRSLQTEDSGEL